MLNVELDSVLKLLAQGILFSELAEDDLQKLISSARIVEFKAGNTVYNKGESGEELYVIIDGNIKVSSVSSDGREAMFGILSPGDLLGESNLLNSSTRAETAVAANNTKLIVFSNKKFLPFLEDYPKLAIKLVEILSDRLRNANSKYEETIFLDMPTRLAKILIELVEAQANTLPYVTRNILKYTQQELANLLGVSRESVNRQLRVWESNHLIEVTRGQILIKNLPGLKTKVPAV